ncbi:plasmid replication initiator TrfA [Methylovulum psychrotolerans]|uniref:TrfA family protein n=1 Tax=Methylovulum psychrotolerans TaxID=1704499 RepID=A0A2S5CFW0_9GAMM|nr:plasmid replication initiator TrfA [Methylovulum psychrotolerans]POZ49694.1 TrfA family protein [Methylovulum psychrotolerans]
MSEPNRSLEKSLANLQRTIEERTAKEGKPTEAEKHAHKTADIIQLPLWPEVTRGTPNSFLRGALFAAIQGKEREYFKGKMLATREGIKIRYTGMQLDQSDLDVWEQAAELARAHPLGNVCHFTIHGFLKALGRNTGNKDHEWLKDVLRRLTASCVEVTHDRYTYGGSLLEFVHDEEKKTYILSLNPKILSMYKAGWTAIDWDIRQKLRRKPLALWLHGYLSSDAENYDTKIETIHRLSGSKTKELWKFKQNLKNALTDIEAATDGQIKATIEGDIVSFERFCTSTQARHIAKKSRKKALPKTPK